jgi:gamma-glutamyl hercynylcysteine S-oxide synthase
LKALNDAHAIRHAGRDLLSLALIDSRNHLLRCLAQDESPAALKRAARAGWYQEHWVSRHLQRQRGEACDHTSPRLAGIEPAIDEWLQAGSAPPAQALREYLAETLELTLELLHTAEETDPGLYFFRMSLLHEDRLCEALLASGAAPPPPARGQRAPIALQAQTWRLGSENTGTAPGTSAQAVGLVPAAERWAHSVQVPEFEIDAQPVNWSQYAEFAQDGGYDRPELWSPEGRAWVQLEGRRAPRHVEQLQGGVLVLRQVSGAAEGGQAQAATSAPSSNPITTALHRAPAGQAAMHITRFEAQAWCAWAGRRLPTEAEWELAASRASSRGFVWGDVLEWVAGSARTWPGAGPVPAGSIDNPPAPGQGVLRGASVLTRTRWHHPKSRRYTAVTQDRWWCGFRSCAL